MPWQGLKPNSISALYGPTKSRALIQIIGAATRENSRVPQISPLRPLFGRILNGMVVSGLSDRQSTEAKVSA